MAFLSLALFAEGKSDYRLLTPLLRRLAEQVCVAEARTVVEVGDVIGVDAPPAYRDADRATRILEAARTFWGGACILFIHADASVPAKAIAERVQPGIDLIRRELRGGNCVAVVPVRETEAWALADGDALRHALGTTLDDAHMGVPNQPRDVEAIKDPKEALRAAFLQVVAPSLRRRSSPSDFFDVLGERIDLARLERVPAFAELGNDLRRALRELGILPRR
ncbi:hypothetical protein BE11_12790 [Sorangium cellulosum]|nr:hypothetical protein BE11_12790 [Sorangium cellulosum]